MAKVLVAYYSRGGTTRAMAEIVAEAAKGGGAATDLREVGTVEVKDLVEYDGIVIGSPTYYGHMAAPIKKLFDDSVRIHGRLEGKVGAAFSSSANVGGGNETTIRGILDCFLVHGMIVPGASHGDHYGPVSIGAPDARVREQCAALGKRVADLVRKLSGA